MADKDEIMPVVSGMKSIAGRSYLHVRKHVRLHREAEDGTRILVMRFWPRGVAKSAVDEWLRELAPSPDLLKWCREKRGAIPHDEFTETWQSRYRAELGDQKDALAGLQQRLAKGEVLTLLCVCHDPKECHRSVLAHVLAGS